jgi:Uma2 family endonuclease
MATPFAKRTTADEFLAWAEAQPQGRYELVSGEIFAMAPKKADHARSKYSACAALKAAIKRAGVPCEAFVDSLAVRIDETTVYEPDALVNCGPRVAGDATVATNPIVVVEVLSPSTAGYDKANKLVDYFSVPSIQHYVIIQTSKNVIIHHKRGEGAVIATTIHTGGTLTLDPPGLTVQVAELLDIG